MRRSEHQWAFLKDISLFINYIDSIGWRVSAGHFYRGSSEQESLYLAGLSNARAGESRHQDRQAADLNFFDPKGNLIIDKDMLMPFGDFWKALSPKNKWGGDFKVKKGDWDVGHFEREL